MSIVTAIVCRARCKLTATGCSPLTSIHLCPAVTFASASAKLAKSASPSINNSSRRKKRDLRSTPYAAQFHLPSALSVRSLYRAVLRAAGRFPDDLVRWYVAQRCRDEWRQYRSQHRERYQKELLARYERQKARLQVRERVQRIQAGESDEAATRAALDMRFDPLQLPPLHQLLITNDLMDVPLDLRRTIHERYNAAKAQLELLHAALDHSDSPATISSRTEVLCAAYGWQGGAVLDRLTHLRAMYINAPHQLKSHTLHSLHPLHRYPVTGIQTHHTHPPPTTITIQHDSSSSSSRRPAVGVYEQWPATESDRLRGESLVSGSRWMECYRLLIMQRVQVLDSGWRRAYSDMLRQRQIIGQVGQQEQPGVKITRAGTRRKGDMNKEQGVEGGWGVAEDEFSDDWEDDGEEAQHMKRKKY